MNNIIAIVGMCGSGKSVACEYLENKGYQKIYFGGVTIDKVKEAGLEVNEQNERMIREKLRKELGMGAYAIVLLPKIEEASLNGPVVLDGLYSWDELVVLKEKFGDNITVICVEADKDLRYARLQERKVRPLTSMDASSRDIAEIENLAKGGPISYADYYILNNSNVEDFHTRLAEILDIMTYGRTRDKK